MTGANVISFYITFIIVLILVSIGGIDGTLRLVQYAELKLRTKWIEYRLYRIKIKLEKELDEWKSSH